MAGQTSALIAALGLGRVDPALVADGTTDALDPAANARLLAATIPGAQLVLYPGAGHGCLFQDAASFIPRPEKFLG
jgi:pimeloyl-ACP methyl ester carboxylesterase